ncbi:MAG: TonB family protein [Mesorhizobium sp.]|nr:TonB family protein [Mesorhizobium sp.]MBN9243903.1 TonB family protein [Mesorhizobium sp.]
MTTRLAVEPNTGEIDKADPRLAGPDEPRIDLPGCDPDHLPYSETWQLRDEPDIETAPLRPVRPPERAGKRVWYAVGAGASVVGHALAVAMLLLAPQVPLLSAPDDDAIDVVLDYRAAEGAPAEANSPSAGKQSENAQPQATGNPAAQERQEMPRSPERDQDEPPVTPEQKTDPQPVAAPTEEPETRHTSAPEKPASSTAPATNNDAHSAEAELSTTSPSDTNTAEPSPDPLPQPLPQKNTQPAPPSEAKKPSHEVSEDRSRSRHEKVEAKEPSRRKAKPTRKDRKPPADGGAKTPGDAAENSRPSSAAATGSGQKSGSTGSVAVANYPGLVHRRLQRTAASAGSGLSGTAAVAFTVDASGGASSIRLAKTSGKPQLDRAALAAVRRASPFPPIPPEANRRNWSFVVPVRFGN